MFYRCDLLGLDILVSKPSNKENETGDGCRLRLLAPVIEPSRQLDTQGLGDAVIMLRSLTMYEVAGMVQNGTSIKAKARNGGQGLLPPATCAADDGDRVFRGPR